MPRDISIATKDSDGVTKGQLLFRLNNKGKFDLYLSDTNRDYYEQKIMIELRFFRGEWFLDTTKGIPYFQEIFIKGVNQADVDSIFKAAILSVSGISSLLSYESEKIIGTREYQISFVVKTIDNEIIDYSVRL